MFLDKDFVLKNNLAKQLYHGYASKVPVIDYHCHLDPQEIYEDGKFENITQAWLGGDHYKWRLMRANGVPEKLITGDGADWDKFFAWADTIEKCIGNPLYVWTHLELKRIFGIEELLTKENAPLIWKKAGKKLQEDSMTTRNIIRKMQVKVICTTDDPASDLLYHQKLADEVHDFKVYPTFRPDRAITIDGPDFAEYMALLGKLTGINVASYADMLKALKGRIQFFHDHGCRLSDHSFTELVYRDVSAEDMEDIFRKGLAKQALTKEEASAYQFGLLCDLLRLYHDQGWTCQLHLLAARNNSSRLFSSLGADVGGDAINDARVAEVISKAFDIADRDSKLPKVILYSLDPKDCQPLTALMGCFQSEIKGKIQLGAAWWFNDTFSGMRRQLTTLAEGGILGNFVGMLTDSRSFLSYPRHEYFRRILCQLVSEWAEDGQVPDDPAILGPVIADISYYNAANYFGFALPEK